MYLYIHLSQPSTSSKGSLNVGWMGIKGRKIGKSENWDESAHLDSFFFQDILLKALLRREAGSWQALSDSLPRAFLEQESTTEPD